MRQRDTKWSLRKRLNFCEQQKGHGARAHTHTPQHTRCCLGGKDQYAHILIPAWRENLLTTHTHLRGQRYQSINTNVQVSPLLSKERPINAHTAIYLYQSAAPCSHAPSLSLRLCSLYLCLSESL